MVASINLKTNCGNFRSQSEETGKRLKYMRLKRIN